MKELKITYDNEMGDETVAKFDTLVEFMDSVSSGEVDDELYEAVDIKAEINYEGTVDSQAFKNVDSLVEYLENTIL